MNDELIVIVFSHYDINRIIDDYVIYYLKSLKNISSKKVIIIFVSDCNLPFDEIKKLDGTADYILAEKHGEYDFGSYKRGFQTAIKNRLLQKTSELIFVNDSCYGPFCSLKDFFDEMNQKDCDFWGYAVNENLYECKFYERPESDSKHVQSYFIVFKNHVFNSRAFLDFINSIKKEENKEDIIVKYEMGLTSILCKAGFKYSAKYYDNIYFYNLVDLFNIKEQKPHMLFKKYTAKFCYYPFVLQFWLKKIKNSTDYPVEIITSNFLRIRDKKLKNNKLLFKFFKSFIKNSVKKIFLFIFSLFSLKT